MYIHLCALQCPHQFTSHSILEYRERLKGVENAPPCEFTVSRLLHFCAGAAAGISSSLVKAPFATAGLQASAVYRSALCHGALFGGYDFFREVLPSVTNTERVGGAGIGPPTKITPQAAVTVGTSGGLAGITHHVVFFVLKGVPLMNMVTVRNALVAFPGGGVAFLTYEYAKVFMG